MTLTINRAVYIPDIDQPGLQEVQDPQRSLADVASLINRIARIHLDFRSNAPFQLRITRDQLVLTPQGEASITQNLTVTAAIDAGRLIERIKQASQHSLSRASSTSSLVPSEAEEELLEEAASRLQRRDPFDGTGEFPPLPQLLRAPSEEGDAEAPLAAQVQRLTREKNELEERLRELARQLRERDREFAALLDSIN